MNIRLLDIGGSGVKTAILPLTEIPSALPRIKSQHFDTPDWNDFPGWLDRQGLLDGEVIGISCAGFITTDGSVKLCRVAGWRDKLLVRDIKKLSPDTRVFLLNDAEAHLMAHLDTTLCPMINLAVGTSLGFAMADEHGRLVRALDRLNFDLGELPLLTSARVKRVWWALGSPGLAALQKEHGPEGGAVRFGYRLGAFMATLCGLFRPTTIVLSGGITAHWWDSFNVAMTTEFDETKPKWAATPSLKRSPFASEAALVGMARYAMRQMRSK